MSHWSHRSLIPSGIMALLLQAVPSCAPAQSESPQPSAKGMARYAPEEVSQGAPSWARRSGPPRLVIDQVCLVPDVRTFLEAVATWDDRHFFPILIDDVDLTFKFLREFRPARIVRFPVSAAKPAGEISWERCVEAVARSWSGDQAPNADSLRGDEVPAKLGPTPPGVVLSNPSSPTLAGAVALAAGRFQPLLRWDTAKRYGDVPSVEEARELASRIEQTVRRLIPRYNGIGDDCDFLTLAGDWPYRYQDKAMASFDGPGVRVLDDLVGRDLTRQSRWAYCGRLLGDAKASVYQAMCSLFLQPRDAMLFNSAAAGDKVWAPYSMDSAAADLRRVMRVSHRAGDRGGLDGWHQSFEGMNRYGLVMINSHGAPTQFHLAGGPGRTVDVPSSCPTVVLMIHSFSAADPADPKTIAGRWLESGAYVYFGSVNEPFLQSFRTPTQVAALASRSIPLVVALRQGRQEGFGQPWRLIHLGDPLYRLEKPRPRVAPSEAFSSWPSYQEAARPADSASDDTRLAWLLRAAIFGFQVGQKPSDSVDVATALLAIHRERLAPVLKPIYDELVADTAMNQTPGKDRFSLFRRIPVSERSSSIRRLIETIRIAELQAALASRDWTRAEAHWDALIRSSAASDVAETATSRVGRSAESAGRLRQWQDRLRRAAGEVKDTDAAPIVAAERKRVADALRPVSKPR